MMHPLFRYRTIGFSFFIEYDLFFPVSMLSGGTICKGGETMRVKVRSV